MLRTICVQDTESGAGDRRQVHILVKPTRVDLQTNLVINTNLRAYHMELRSTEKTYMASVSWQYPAGSVDRAAPPERPGDRADHHAGWYIHRARTAARHGPVGLPRA